MLDTDRHRSEDRASTGLEPLDAVLDRLYWGDNVVWQLDGAPVEPFYTAIADAQEHFETRTLIAIDAEPPPVRAPGLQLLRAGPGTDLAHPADLLREVHRICHAGEHRLLLFDSLDSMVRAWGSSGARGFFARCCPLLLDLGAIGYWSMSARDTPTAVRDTVESVTQCVLRVDERSIRVAKAEGRGEGARGAVLHWHLVDGMAVLAPANITGRVAASLRALRRARALSQQELAGLAGVTASAISQAERAERGLSLGTLAQLSSALGITIDDLLHGDEPDTYRIGRRTDHPQHSHEPSLRLLGDSASEIRVDLVQLGPRESHRQTAQAEGAGIVAVSSGLVQVMIGGQTPAVRAGEVLVAGAERVDGWRNMGQTEAVLFWIVVPVAGRRLRLDGGIT
ncbi:MAG TPA: helix-turn-helix transcriptional regulator [Solirubrobacteraceae bacterium]|nr:helix-turn-helix transcriptional regulator [Solirubrobacteraceae bacterium]